MKSIQKISSYVLLLLGVVHTVLTPVFYSQFSEGALWFAGTGLGLVFLALLNLAVLLSPTHAGLNLCLVADLAGLLYGILIVVGLRGPEPQPHAYIALAAYLAVTVGTIFSRKTVQ
jgi:hypothetical protein